MRQLDKQQIVCCMEEEVNSSIQDRKIRNCQLVESNCEYLTLVRRCISDEHMNARNSLRKLNEYISTEKARLMYDQFASLLVQLGYLMFSCKYHNMMCQIGPDSYRIEEIPHRGSQKSFVPVVFYELVEKDPEPNYFSVSLSKAYDYLLEAVSQHEKSNDERNEHRATVDTFREQYVYLKGHGQHFNSREKEFFMCLEETALYRTYSILLQIKNSSILDHIKTNEDNLKTFKEFRRKDVKLVSEYGNEKKKPKNDMEKLRTKEKDIELNVSSFFKALHPKNKIEEEPFVKEKDHQSSKLRFTFIVEEKLFLPFKKAVAAIVKEIGLSIEEEGRDDKPPGKLEFSIEYSSDKNSICVRLLNPNINVNVETSDFIMYQANLLTFDTANVSIELSDIRPTEKNLTPRKALVFKGASCFNTKEPPLEKILLLMDITMISSKIYEPELLPPKGYSRDSIKFSTISNKVNHYTRIFMKCAKKIYSEE